MRQQTRTEKGIIIACVGLREKKYRLIIRHLCLFNHVLNFFFRSRRRKNHKSCYCATAKSLNRRNIEEISTLSSCKKVTPKLLQSYSNFSLVMEYYRFFLAALSYPKVTSIFGAKSDQL